MKRNKKGFTLVELVIVIAVIAILAGVMIAVFSGVVRRANENAELQQVKNDELKQKAEDVLTKLDNANWFSWEDFENSLAAKLTEAYKNSTAAQLTTEQIQDAVKKALEDYAKNNATENSQLTETQVKVIIENAISEAKLGGVTEAQVRTIVNTAVGSINTVSKADIQRIVDAETSKGLTAVQVAKVINDAGLATSTQLENVSAKVNDAITAINALKPVTKKDVSDAIIDLVPVTYTINTAEDLADALARVKSFSTLNFTSEYTTSVGNAVVITLPESDDRVLTIKGVKLEDLTVNAPGATVYLATDAGNVLVTATAGNSFHVVKNVETLTVNKGRVVVEDNAVVDELKAAPSLKATVKVVIEEEGTVKNLNAEYQKNGNNTNDWIEVENNGTVGTAQLTLVSNAPTANTQVTTNVKVTNGENAKGTEVGTGAGTISVAENVPSVRVTVADETNSGTDYYVDTTTKTLVDPNEVEFDDQYVARIGLTGYYSLAEAVSAAGTYEKTIVLLKNIELEARIDIPNRNNLTIDLNGKNISNKAGTKFNIFNSDNGLNTGNFTVINTSSTQSVVSLTSNSSNAIFYVGGTITIGRIDKSGKTSCNNILFEGLQGGTGTTYSSYAYIFYATNTSSYVINGGEYHHYNQVTKLSGGTANKTSANLFTGLSTKTNITINDGVFSTVVIAQVDNFVINGGTFNDEIYYGSNSTVALTVNDGTFNGKFIIATTNSDTVYPDAVTINGGTFNEEFCTLLDSKTRENIKIKGGTFKVTNPEQVNNYWINYFNDSSRQFNWVRSFLASGYTVTESNGVWKVTK